MKWTISYNRITISVFSFISIFLLFPYGCNSVPFENRDDLRLEIVTSDIPENIGVYNALKKAAQMKNVTWKTTAKGMPYNNGYFDYNTKYSGIPYSNVLAYNQHVFFDVNIETFITAVHNPRSVLYTENVSENNSKSALGRKYNGKGSACYYGSTCSYLIVYAFGLPFGILAEEFPYWEEVEVVENQSADGVKLADVLSSRYHVVLVTDIKRYVDGSISTITITENAGATTSSKVFTPSEFEEYLSTGYTIMRYKNIAQNTNYTPLTDFVAVDDEVLGHYSFNEDLCPNYGNRSNYVEGDVVIINVTEDYKEKGYKTLMVYKDNDLLSSIYISDFDICLQDLPYGDYKVCLTDGSTITSDYSYFKVVNMSVSLDCNGDQNVVYFSSKNAKPLYYDFCEENGQKGPHGLKMVLSHLLTQEEVFEGKAVLSPPLVPTESVPYIKVHFETEYGRTVKAARKVFSGD